MYEQIQLIVFTPLPLASSYFREISSNLSNWQLNQTAVYLLAFVFCSIAFIAICAYAFSTLKKKNKESENFFEISNKKEIMATLSRAWKDRSKFELKLDPDSRTASICSLYELKEESITLELPSQVKPASDWTGKPGYVFFSVPLQNKQRLFYFFETPINAQLEKRKFYLVQLQFPKKIEQKQKRKHLRYEPSLDQVQLSLWDKSALNPQNNIFTTEKLPLPLLKTKETDPSNALDVMNISATGLRIKLPQASKQTLPNTLEKQNILLLALFLKDSEDPNCFPLYLKAKIRNLFEDFTSKDLEIGFEFTHHSRADPANPNNLQWLRVDPESGVDPISNWVFKQHLKMYREKGIS